MQGYQQRNSGVSLIDLLAALIIISIIVSIGIPIYKRYRTRAYFYQVIQAAIPYQTAVENCYQKRGALDRCDSGTYDIPEGIYTAHSHVALLVVENGVITVVPVPGYGVVEDDTYILTPAPLGASLQWTVSGGGVEHGYTD